MGGAIISESGGGINPLQGGGIIPELGGGFLRNLEGYLRSPARRFVRHERRPHISRIERRRGPVSLYGERSTATSNLSPAWAQ